MSNAQTIRDMRFSTECLSDPLTERIWLYKQLGFSFKKISELVKIAESNVQNRFHKRIDYANRYDMIEADYMRSE